MSSMWPWMKFFPGDWMKDPALRAVSLAAQGLWINLLCLMWESPIRGELRHMNGHAVTRDQIARMVGASTGQLGRLMNELEECGVFSRRENGVIYSRRMVRGENAAIGHRERQAKYERQTKYRRMASTNGKGDGPTDAATDAATDAKLTPQLTGHISEVRNQKSEILSSSGSTPTSSARRDSHQPESEIELGDWEKACKCADRIEQADVAGDGVVEVGGSKRAIAFALLADWMRDRHKGGWPEIEGAVDAIVSDPQWHDVLRDLQRWPDGAYPQTTSNGKRKSSRIMRVMAENARRSPESTSEGEKDTFPIPDPHRRI